MKNKKNWKIKKVKSECKQMNKKQSKTITPVPVKDELINEFPVTRLEQKTSRLRIFKAKKRRAENNQKKEKKINEVKVTLSLLEFI